MNETSKPNTNTSTKLRETSFLPVFASAVIICPLQISSPLKTTSGLEAGLSDRAGVCYLDWKQSLGVIPLALNTEELKV